MIWLLYICMAAGILSIIYSVVYFVGYWVSADYYTKLSFDFKARYKTFIFFTLFINLVIIFPGIFSMDRVSDIFKVALFVNGVLHLGLILVLTFFKVKKLFQQSRKYFANKRNIKI